MSSTRHFLVTGHRRIAPWLVRHPGLSPISRYLSSSNSTGAKPATKTSSQPVDETVPSTASPDGNPSSAKNSIEKPGAIGGFMRGLIGGQSVAVEDAFVAEAKEQGVELPKPPPQHHSSLVPVRRRKRRDEGDEDRNSQSIRDRIFGRFTGSAFMKNAFEAKERIKETIDESDNPIINMFRNIYDRIFAENEMGMVIREIREEDPDFRISEFLHLVEVDLIPKILSPYLLGDQNELSSYCTQEANSMLNASIKEREVEGIVMDTNILHISEVELTAARLLEDSPVLIVTFNTQQINCLRDRVGNIIEGKEDDIRAVYYAWAFVREAEFEEIRPSGGGMGATKYQDPPDGSEDKGNKYGDANVDHEPKVKPWKLMEMVIRGAHSTI